LVHIDLRHLHLQVFSSRPRTPGLLWAGCRLWTRLLCKEVWSGDWRMLAAGPRYVRHSCEVSTRDRSRAILASSKGVGIHWASIIRVQSWWGNLWMLESRAQNAAEMENVAKWSSLKCRTTTAAPAPVLSSCGNWGKPF
jgi:hypothetical protein